MALTRSEFDVLEALSARPKLVFSDCQFIDAVWDTRWVGGEPRVDLPLDGRTSRRVDDLG